MNAKTWAGMLVFVLAASSAGAQTLCASAEQAAQVREYLLENPGTQPAIVAVRLGLPEALVVSALDKAQAAATSGAAFPEVWKAMEIWDQASFMIMKEANVFEILSSVGKGKPSEVSQYFNIEYSQPLRGHLRPDLYASIYAVAIPVKDDVVSRGVIFYDADGASVFAAFISGDSMDTTPAEIAKFDAVMAMVREAPGVCP